MLRIVHRYTTIEPGPTLDRMRNERAEPERADSQRTMDIGQPGAARLTHLLGGGEILGRYSLECSLQPVGLFRGSKPAPDAGFVHALMRNRNNLLRLGLMKRKRRSRRIVDLLSTTKRDAAASSADFRS